MIMPEEIRKSLQKSESVRRGDFDALVEDFDELARAIELLEKKQVKLPRGETNMWFTPDLNAAARKTEITKLHDELSKRKFELQKVGGNPAYVTTVGTGSFPPIRVGHGKLKWFQRLESGVIFRFKAASVISVAGPTEMLVRINIASDPRELQDIWLSGFSTADVIDGTTFRPKVPVIISGTKAYTSASGASRTVFKAVAFDPSQYYEGAEKNTNAKPANSDANAADANEFVGKWKIVNDKGVVGAYFTLDKAFTAKKSHVPSATAKWEVVGSDARITWSDGWKDVLRPQNGRVAKIAFGPGKSWGDKPDNEQWAIKE